MKKYFFILYSFLSVPSILFAYLDPGTGSLLLSSFIAIIASSMFFLKNIYYRLIPLINIEGGSIL